MSNFSLEPKNGDFAAVVDKLGEHSLSAMKNEIQSSNQTLEQNSNTSAVSNQQNKKNRSKQKSMQTYVTNTDEARAYVAKKNETQAKAREKAEQENATSNNVYANVKVTTKTPPKKNSVLTFVLIFFFLSVVFNIISGENLGIATVAVPLIIGLIFFFNMKNKNKQKG